MLLALNAEHSMTRRTADLVRDIAPTLSGVKPLDPRTLLCRLKKRVGFDSVSYDCCPNSCMCYAPYPEATQCDHCGELRPKSGKATFQYIPLIPRLLLMWSNPGTARLMTHYPIQVRKDTHKENGRIYDFWSGNCDHAHPTVADN